MRGLGRSGRPWFAD